MRKTAAATLALISALSLVVTGCGGAKEKDPKPAPAVEQPAPQTTTPEPAKPAEPAKTDPVQPEPAKPAPEPPKPAKREMPKTVRGIHFSGWYAGSPDLSGPLLDWAKSAGINTVVLDLKAEDGKISWISEVPLAKEIGSNERKVGDFPKLIAELHEKGFWVAGRIVVMNDQYLYRSRPSWGIPGFPGGPYSFMDPKNENVWQYNIDIAKEAIKHGVDEIQWDYIRYPEKLVEAYNRNTGPEYRTSHINNFLKRTMAELKPLGVVVGADLFGLTTSVAIGDDMEIGQDYKLAMEIVDYVAAMAYPSHYAPGTYGLDDPNRHPYETVKGSIGKAVERTQGLPLEKHRPWIQDFNLGGVRYGTAELAAQVKALKELGINSYMIWDPSNKYTRGLDYSKL